MQTALLNEPRGEWVRPNVKEYLDVINPATGMLIAKMPLGGKADVNAAAMESFFGDMHGQGMDAVEFFTQKKLWSSAGRGNR